MTMVEVPEPTVADGSLVQLANGGSTFVRDLPAATDDAPVLLLLHGWCVTADVNFGTAYDVLTRHFRVVALDHRGHGQGRLGPFSFAACADDAIAVLDHLGIGTATVLGYSMGGPIALDVERRHGHRVDGLVLAATSLTFTSSRRSRARFFALRSLSRISPALPDTAADKLLATIVRREAAHRFSPWVVDQISGGDLTNMLRAGGALGTYDGAATAPLVSVPTSVVVLSQDTVVAPANQARLADAVPFAQRFDAAVDHDGCLATPEVLNPVLLDACLHASPLTPGRR